MGTVLGVGATTSAEAQALLASLVGFIQPLAQSCLSVADATALACNGVEGREFIMALGNFVAAMVAPQVHIPQDTFSRREKVDVRPHEREASRVVAPPAPSVQRPISRQGLPAAVVEAVYRRVFNEMPIRVLAFDRNGTHLQLLERSAMADLILSCVQASSPPSGQLDVDLGLQRAEAASRYAILSHTWIRDTPGEVVYGDWTTRELPAHERGYAKIAKFCEVAAREHGVSFGWMDTVCINKDSSTELDESIRSMYRWYRLAHVCVTYLSQTAEIEQMHRDSWFTRGWTLQELLAPRNIKFYNEDWEPLVPNPSASEESESQDYESEFAEDLEKYLRVRGVEKVEDGSEVHFTNEIPIELQCQIYKATSITRIELLVFRADSEADIVPISRKMQLAAMRTVTREEDKIYSLMGLLGVGIPVAYGEGLRSAFIRFIREIMASKEHFLDIFNHGSKERHFLPSNITDYLNRSSIFDRTHLALESTLHNQLPIEPITMTHMGVRIPLLLVPAFNRNSYKKDVPLLSVSQIVTITDCYGSQQDYIMLKDDAFSANWIKGLSRGGHPLRLHPVLIFLGILNFSEEGHAVKIPSACISIPIDPRLDAGYWKVGEFNPVHARPLSGPMALPWVNYSLQRPIDPDQMRRRGMQVSTLYLK